MVHFVWHPANGGMRFVNLSLTLVSAFLLLKDLQRNRLDARLTQLKPLIIMAKMTERDAIAAACAVHSDSSQALIRDVETYLTDFCASQ